LKLCGMNKRRDNLQKFYLDIELQVGLLEDRHTGFLQCSKGCSDCCVDDLTIYEVEADNIREHYPDFLKTEQPGPPGKCAFLNKSNSCRIYEHRPYVCRTQGLPLRWWEDLSDGSQLDMRDICPLNDPHLKVESLEADSCWTIGSHEARLVNLQADLFNGRMTRIYLRDLFLLSTQCEQETSKGNYQL